MGKRKSTTKSTETATTTPTLASYLQGPVQNYYSSVSDLQKLPSSSVVAPTNALQQQAAGGAAGLGVDSQGYDAARGFLNKSLLDTINTRDATATKAQVPGALNTTNVANVNGPAVAQAGLSYLPTAAQATDTSGLAGKDVATYGGAAASGYIKNYLDPYLNDNVAASMAAFDDNAGREQAGYAAQGAKAKAFGGSRFAIGEAQLLSDQTRNRALTDAQLRSDAWTKSLGAAQGDAANANSAGIASMQAQNQRDETLGSLASQLGMFNAGQVNTNNQSIFDALNQMGLFNAGAQNTANNAKFGVDAANAQANASEANTNERLGYTTRADIEKANAAATTQTSQFNAGLGLDRAGQIAGLGTSLASILGQQGDAQRANIGLQAQLGDSQYARELQQQLAPYTQQQILSELLNGGGLLGATTGQTGTTTGTATKTSSGSLLDKIAAGVKIGTSIASVASERRVKRDIVKRGEDADGMGWYDFRYIWDRDTDPMRFGTMRDEVERLRPWALGPIIDGVGTVNYGAL